GRNVDDSGIDSAGHASSLIVAEEEDFVAADGPADGSAELLAIVFRPLRREEVSGGQAGVAREVEHGAVQLILTAPGGDRDLAAAEIPVFGVKVARQDSKLLDGIEIGDYGREHVEVFLDRASVDDEAVAGLALSADGDVARVQVTRGRSTRT